MNDLPAWLIEDVDPEAQEAAKLAARRVGVPVGRWLTQTIMHAASSELRRGRGREGGHQPPALTTEVLLENIRALADRIETAEQRSAEALTPLAEKVTSLGQRIEEVSTRAASATAPVERALTRLAERLERLEKGELPAESASTTTRRRWFGAS